MDANLFERTETGNEDFMTSIVFNFIKFVTEDLDSNYFQKKFAKKVSNFRKDENPKVNLWPHPPGASRGNEPDVVISNNSCYLIIENKLNRDFRPKSQFEERDKKIMKNKDKKTSALRISDHFSRPKSLEEYEEVEWISWRDIRDWTEKYSEKHKKNEAIKLLCHSIISCMESERIMGFEGFVPENYWAYIISRDRLRKIVENLYNLSKDLEDYFERKEKSFELKHKTQAPISNIWERWMRDRYHFSYYPPEISNNFGRSHTLFLYVSFRGSPRALTGIRLCTEHIRDGKTEGNLDDLKKAFEDFRESESGKYNFFSSKKGAMYPLIPELGNELDYNKKFVGVTKEIDWNRFKKSGLDREELFKDIYYDFKKFHENFRLFLENIARKA